MTLRIFILLFFCISSLFAQTPIKVVIYSHDSASVLTTGDTAKVVKSKSGFKNLLKWNFGLLARGTFMLNYERHITDRFTLEIGGGPTYSDFIFTQYYDVGSLVKNDKVTTTNTSSGSVTTSLLRTPFENSSKSIGFAVEVCPRFYFDKAEFDGFYLSPHLGYSKFNYGVTVQEQDGVSYNEISKSFTDLHYTFVDLGFKMGYQFSAGDYYSYSRYRTFSYSSNDNFYYDIYLGAAYRMVNLVTLQKTDTQSYYANYTTFYSEFTQTFGLVRMMIGAKLGYIF